MDNAPPERDPSTALLVAAFAAVYLIWGSTYLAIRIAIETLPGFLMAGTRFLVAGGLLYFWARVVKRRPKPSLANWRSALLCGGLMLLGGNGGVVWAEQHVPSGLVALLVAIVPIWMVLVDWLRPGGIRPTVQTALGVVLGFVGIGVLVGPEQLVGGGAVNWLGAIVLAFASLSWAVGSICSKYAGFPPSPMLVTAMQMLSGGALLAVLGLATGESGDVQLASVSLESAVSLGYLILFGSVIGYSAYVWLLRVSTPAKVSTYAYVNPVVAILLGWALANEPLSPRVFIATAVILTALMIVTISRHRKPQAA